MSVANRGQGSAAADFHNQENMLSRLRGKAAPAEDQENIPPKPANRTVLGALQNNQRTKTNNQRGIKQEHLSCKNEDFSKSCFERSSKQPAFQVHVDEPDGTCTKKSLAAAETLKAKSVAEDSPLVINNAVAQLRQPLATIDFPAAMDVSLLDSPMDMSVIEGEEKTVNANEVPEYAAEIHTYLREMEVKTRPKAGYMKKQPDITNSMRSILVDWLVEVGEEYKLQNETLYLAVNYIDRFLSSMSVLRGKLQLVGTAAMLLASKFEEIYPPEVAEFVYITDDTYTRKQVLRMEHLVLKVLSFDLAAPTINQFLTQYILNQSVSKQVESLAMYLSELSLIDSEPCLKYLPSQTAAAAYILANHTVTGGSWPKSLTDMSGYSLEDLMPCVEDLHKIYLNAPQHAQQSIREKYKTQKYHEVSLVDAPAKLLLK
ncbi:cyclin-A2 [Periophthalmus magnuspinnatus]|uniref:cyclin-A2 n=1 Tax=Periophthalmus magnuspinnatus TaxID=409849 RepID=UPI00145A9BE6|nr:cyclin-A2 [Periophthalmus magnuspinnatus]